MIWKKHLFKQLLFTFCFFFVLIFFLFILIDLSTRINSFQSDVYWSRYLFYYFYQLIRYGEIFLALAAILSLTKVTLQFNQNRELIALLASGVSKKKLSEPFVFFALLCFALLIFNNQVLQPAYYLQLGEQKEFEHRESPLTPVWMEDQSLFLFRHYSSVKQTVSQCLWIKDAETIVHMHSLDLISSLASEVEIFTKKEGAYSLLEKNQFLEFPSYLLPKNLHAAFCPLQFQSISQLFSYLPFSFTLSEKESQAAAYGCYKIAFPFLFLFLYVMIMLLCLRFRRSHFGLWFYGLSLFGLFFCFTLLKALLILSESQIFSPYLAFGSVTLIPFITCVINYGKL